MWTDSRIGAMSSGATVRRSMTSTEMPSPATSVGGRDRLVHHPRHRHHGDVGAGAHDGRHADRDDVVGRRLGPLHAVEQPVLDEDDGVGVLDRGTEQPVGVGRGRRHDDAQAGDVREQRLEALRVLAPRRAPGAELGSHRERHLRGAAGHERQLGGLVEQLVEAHAEEVEVHELDDGPHSRHGRADAEARRSRSRRSGCRGRARRTGRAARAMRPNTLPPAADVDPGDEDALVARRARLRARRGSRPSCGTPGRRRRGAGGSAPYGSRADDEVGQRGRRRARRADGGIDRVVELARDRRLHRRERVVGDARRRGAARVRPAAGRAPPTPRPRRPIGTAAGRLRSDRASGRWRLRR